MLDRVTLVRRGKVASWPLPSASSSRREPVPRGGDVQKRTEWGGDAEGRRGEEKRIEDGHV